MDKKIWAIYQKDDYNNRPCKGAVLFETQSYSLRLLVQDVLFLCAQLDHEPDDEANPVTVLRPTGTCCQRSTLQTRRLHRDSAASSERYDSPDRRTLHLIGIH